MRLQDTIDVLAPDTGSKIPPTPWFPASTTTLDKASRLMPSRRVDHIGLWTLLLFPGALGFCRFTILRTKIFNKPSNPSSLLVKQTNGEIPPAKGINGNSTVTRRRKRGSDFPAYCYKSSKQTNRRSKKLKSSSVSGLNTPTSVSLPSFSEKVSPIWEQFLMAVFGPSTIRDEVAKRTRLLEERSYARKEPFAMENITRAPNLEDVSSTTLDSWEGLWISTPFRVGIFGSAYLLFPFVTRFLDNFVTMPPEQLDEITSKFGPGVSILYGTFISLTLSILYNRQRALQTDGTCVLSS